MGAPPCLTRMKKGTRIEAFADSLAPEAEGEARFYLGYFVCFNRQLYYEAHDVLEHLWLEVRGSGAPEELFYKGLIQLAGAYVHLQKQFLRPQHPKDGRRLRPAVRLLRLAMANLNPYRPRYRGLDLEAVHQICDAMARQIEAGEYAHNPWSPALAPELIVQP